MGFSPSMVQAFDLASDCSLSVDLLSFETQGGHWPRGRRSYYVDSFTISPHAHLAESSQAQHITGMAMAALMIHTH